MSQIQVLDIFHNTFGLIAILRFPENEYPRIGMILRKSDNSYWKISGTAVPKLSELTNGYNYFDPPIIIYDCKIEPQSTEGILVKGDILFL